MTEERTDRLWIWVTNWEKFQGRRDRPNLPWFRVYSELTSDDDWNDLSTADRCLLVGVLSDTNRLGLGRVSANLTALRSRHRCRRASLEPLIQAGFITLSTTKGAPTGYQLGVLEESRGSKDPKKEIENARAAPGASAAAHAQNGNEPVDEEEDEPMSKEEMRAAIAAIRPQLGAP